MLLDLENLQQSSVDLDESKEMAFDQKPEHEALPKLTDLLPKNQESLNHLRKAYSSILHS